MCYCIQSKYMGHGILEGQDKDKNRCSSVFLLLSCNCIVPSGLHSPPWRSSIPLALRAEIKGHICFLLQ